MKYFIYFTLMGFGVMLCMTGVGAIIGVPLMITVQDIAKGYE